jgi:fructose-1,6-bisphosphatase/inositol monophosphatase family enzyme
MGQQSGSTMNDYLDFAKKLALQAGDIMLQYFDTDIAVETKEDASPLTIADTTINKMVIAAIHEKYPDHGIIGEEESDHTVGTKYVWVCDPIDGTIPFTMGVPTSQFSLALVKDGVSILGVLYDPYTKRMYEAVKGARALR